jgi:hypothetical protein
MVSYHIIIILIIIAFGIYLKGPLCYGHAVYFKWKNKAINITQSGLDVILKRRNIKGISNMHMLLFNN